MHHLHYRTAFSQHLMAAAPLQRIKYGRTYVMPGRKRHGGVGCLRDKHCAEHVPEIQRLDGGVDVRRVCMFHESIGRRVIFAGTDAAPKL